MAIKTLLLGVALASVAAGMFSNQRRKLTMGGTGPSSRTGLANSDRSTGDNMARDMASASDSGRSTPGMSSGTGMGSGLSGGLSGGLGSSSSTTSSSSGLGGSGSGRSLTGGTPGTNDDLLSPGTTSGVGPTPGGPL